MPNRDEALGKNVQKCTPNKQKIKTGDQQITVGLDEERKWISCTGPLLLPITFSFVTSPPRPETDRRGRTVEWLGFFGSRFPTRPLALVS